MNLSGWVLSVAGMVVLTAIVDVVLPQGNMGKIIKGVFSFVCVLVIAMPLPSLLKGKFVFKDFYDDTALTTQSHVISNTIYEMRREQLFNEIETALERKGVTNCDVEICSINEDSFVKVNLIKINLDKAVIKPTDGNILDVEGIKKVVADVAAINPEMVTVYG